MDARAYWMPTTLWSVEYRLRIRENLGRFKSFVVLIDANAGPGKERRPGSGASRIIGSDKFSAQDD